LRIRRHHRVPHDDRHRGAGLEGQLPRVAVEQAGCAVRGRPVPLEVHGHGRIGEKADEQPTGQAGDTVGVEHAHHVVDLLEQREPGELTGK
jgi:hypothetical protein